jgi:hypothetical protein
MRKGIEFIGKVDEAWVPSSVFGSDTRNVCCADGIVVVALWAQLLVVADMRTGQHATTPARVSWPFSLV